MDESKTDKWATGSSRSDGGAEQQSSGLDGEISNSVLVIKREFKMFHKYFYCFYCVFFKGSITLTANEVIFKL